jgi:hypothetical protein
MVSTPSFAHSNPTGWVIFAPSILTPFASTGTSGSACRVWQGARKWVATQESLADGIGTLPKRRLPSFNLLLLGEIRERDQVADAFPRSLPEGITGDAE